MLMVFWGTEVIAVVHALPPASVAVEMLVVIPQRCNLGYAATIKLGNSWRYCPATSRIAVG